MLPMEVKPVDQLKTFLSNDESEFFSDQHKTIRDLINVDENEVVKVWEKLEKKLDIELEKIRVEGNKLIPETSWEKIMNNGGNIPEEAALQVKKRGVLIVRNTIPEAEAKDMLADILKYLNSSNGFPEDRDQPFVSIYWSKPQMKARQHPNMFAVQKALLGLWHKNADNQIDVNLDKPVMYIDRMRIRSPGDSQVKLPPHVDVGGVEIWSDPTYLQIYRKIFENFEDHDPFEVDYRTQINTNESGIPNGGCTFFRAFQGWMSLSHSGPGMGTLRVLPLLKESTAYWILRPFLPDVPKDLFPGCSPGKTLYISPKWHAKLFDALISMPEISPGDTVWWHPDVIHSVERQHHGTEHNAVFYIPAGPDCAINRGYLKLMRQAFAMGTTPPDFQESNYEKDSENQATYENDVTDLGRQMMGWPEVRIAKETGES